MTFFDSRHGILAAWQSERCNKSATGRDLHHFRTVFISLVPTFSSDCWMADRFSANVNEHAGTTYTAGEPLAGARRAEYRLGVRSILPEKVSSSSVNGRTSRLAVLGRAFPAK